MYSQEINDAGLWCTFNLEKQLAKKFNLLLTEEYRIKENFSQNNLFYTDIGAEYKAAKFLKISFSYRNIQKFSNDNVISFRHRLSLNITLKHKFEHFILSYRQRLQSEIRNIYSSDMGAIPEWYSRNKFEVKYDFDKPIVPYAAIEIRYQIVNPRAVNSNGLWHRNRYIAGLNYKLNDKHSFGLYYLIQNEYNVSIPQNQYIIGLEYNLSL